MYLLMANAITKQDAINHIAEQTGLTKKDSKDAIESLLGFVTDNLKEEQKVNFIGFGSFEVRERAKRTGRNPQTGEPIEISARKVPAFKPGKDLRDAVKGQ